MQAGEIQRRHPLASQGRGDRGAILARRGGAENLASAVQDRVRQIERQHKGNFAHVHPPALSVVEFDEQIVAGGAQRIARCVKARGQRANFGRRKRRGRDGAPCARGGCKRGNRTRQKRTKPAARRRPPATRGRCGFFRELMFSGAWGDLPPCDDSIA